MKLKVELASSELKSYIVGFFKENYNEDISNLYGHFGYWTPEELAKLVEENYDKVHKTLYNLDVEITYYSPVSQTKEKISNARLEHIIKSYVKQNFNLDAVSVKYAMIVDDYCVSQVENPYTAWKIDGKVIAECEIQTEAPKVLLEMV